MRHQQNFLIYRDNLAENGEKYISPKKHCLKLIMNVKMQEKYTWKIPRKYNERCTVKIIVGGSGGGGWGGEGRG